MDQFIIYLILFSIIVLLGQVFQKSTIPIALILVIAGMLLSLVPYFPEITLDPTLVLNFFLPLLVYEIGAFSSWRDVKRQFRPIALLSVGHVIFITVLVAIVIHFLIPQLGWPLAFVLGAIISPPDDVAIVSIAEKIKMPERIFIILEGEGMFNDAAALTLFRFALAAAITNQFSAIHAASGFVLIIIGETIYGLILGHLLGKIRERISNAALHVIASFITPFAAYIPVVYLGGTGVLATAIVGFIIGNQYTLRFTPEYRLIALSIWPTLAFALQGLIFLLVGLDLRSIFMRISSIPIQTLILYISSITLVIIIGRFIWVYGALISLPRILFPSLRKKDPYPPWQYPFVISWSGIRGGISLAAALAIPALAFKIDGVNPRDLLIFIVFCIILITLVLQGLSLPFILKAIGIDKVGQSERYKEHLTELQARRQMVQAAIDWMEKYKEEIKHHKKLLADISLLIYEYQRLKKDLGTQIYDHDGLSAHDEEAEIKEQTFLLLQIIDVEKDEISKMWHDDKINLRTRNKLIAVLDHQIQRHAI
jgi:CPA1 family monovalent cation:H+ antiporter